MVSCYLYQLGARNWVKFYFGARIFDPSYAKTLSDQQAYELIDKMEVYPIFLHVQTLIKKMGGESSSEKKTKMQVMR